MTEHNENSDYDIVIAGGGMIGTSLALALAPLGLRLPWSRLCARKAAGQPSFDERSTALSRSTQRMFEAMGSVGRDSSPPPHRSRHIHVSDQGRFGFSHIDAEEQGVEALGYVVINRVLGDVLQNALDDVADVDVLCPARIVIRHCSAERAIGQSLTLRGDRQTLSCDLLVAADGASSSVRDMMGIRAETSDYRQRAVIGNLLPEKPLDNRAYERFTTTGPAGAVADCR